MAVILTLNNFLIFLLLVLVVQSSENNFLEEGLMGNITRRDFLGNSVKISASAVLGADLLSRMVHAAPSLASDKGGIDIAVIESSDYAKNTVKSVELLGGMEKFVPKNSTVALLINTMARNQATFVKPEIVRAVIQMCKQAGAKEIAMISWLPPRAWETSGISKVAEEEGAALKLIDGRNEANFKTIPVPNGKILKEAKVMQEFFNYDIFIDLPISKNHYGVKITGTMKNLMGLTSPALNGFFHKGDRKSEAAENIEHLSQCIADLNTVIKPTLCVVDATEIITTNGPMGPGEVIKPRKVIAGVDRVAIDTYCTGLLGLQAKDILIIPRAYEHRLGEMNLKKVSIKEISL